MLKKIFVPIFLLLGLAVVGVLLFAGDIDVTITEQQVQAKIDEQIAEGPIQSRGIELTINSARIDFKASDAAEIVADITADGFGYSGTMAGTFLSGIRYDQPEIFLDNILTSSIELAADAETEGRLQDVKNVASDFLTRQRDAMLSDEAKESFENIVGRNEDTIKDVVAAGAYKFFETLPVYDLNEAGIKGSLASLALKDVRFTETSAIVTLSPVQALIKILSFIGVTLLVLWACIGFYLPTQRKKSNE